MDGTQQAIRILILALATAVVVLCAVAWWRRPSQRVWLLVPAWWSAHVAGFYAAVLWGHVAPKTLNLWSSALWLHSVILVLVGVWLFIWPARPVFGKRHG